MIWWIIALGTAAVAAAGTVLRKRTRSRPPIIEPAAAEPARVLTDADRVRHIAPAAPMVGLEAALDEVTDSQGRTLREQLDADGTDVGHLRVDDDTSPILRRALDHVAPDVSNPEVPSDETSF